MRNQQNNSIEKVAFCRKKKNYGHLNNRDYSEEEREKMIFVYENGFDGKEYG